MHATQPCKPSHSHLVQKQCLIGPFREHEQIAGVVEFHRGLSVLFPTYEARIAAINMGLSSVGHAPVGLGASTDWASETHGDCGHGQ